MSFKDTFLRWTLIFTRLHLILNLTLFKVGTGLSKVDYWLQECLPQRDFVSVTSLLHQFYDCVPLIS